MMVALSQISIIALLCFILLIDASTIVPQNSFLIRNKPDGQQRKKLIPVCKENVVIVGQEIQSAERLGPLKLCFCGAIATMFGDFIMHPIDTIKIVQQATGVGKKLNFAAAVRQILSGPAGVLGFYSGVVPYLISDGTCGAIKFASFEVSKVFLLTQLPTHLSPLADFVAAAGSMITSSFILVPGEVIKTRLQTGMIKSMAEGVSSILRTEGIMGLFAGYYATLIRDLPYTILELGIYENIKTLIRRHNLHQKNPDQQSGVGSISQSEELLAAAVTGGFVALVTTPLDLVKTKLMMQSTSGGAYTGFLDALRSIYGSGGMPALFVGSLARVTWLLPFTTIYLGVYEASKRLLIQQQIAAKQARVQ
mmetsp:Transcript_4890/g.7271  ORF Transcript_4890/g.7271 Transcript_4890/m.7271 type:complete len:365 (-) Transcript_4890:71-1165(-)